MVCNANPFQLTRSRGAWQTATIITIYQCHFNSHAHVERDPALLFFSFSSSIFQLTRSRGAWLAIPKLSIPAIRISTHTLTWSVTRCILPYVIPPKISTHTLTWSVTSWIPGKTHWQEQFQLTRSRGAWQTYHPEKFGYDYFNSHAHVERDDMREKRGMTQDISTHTLTWSVTSGAPRRSRSGRFQLTRSRGAWREVDPHLKDKRDFNSHAHVERDIADEYGYEKYSRFQLTRSRGAWRAENGNDYFAVIISTHTLTWSVTCKEKGFTIWICHFNSHAHVERDIPMQWRC